MAPQDPQNAALLAHIVAQVEQNIQFLNEHNYISSADASAILSRLPNVNNNQAVVMPVPAAAAARGVPPYRNTRGAVNTPPPPPAFEKQEQPPTIRARALWAYNEKGQVIKEGNDLSFSAGDVIEIIEETNADWWLGRVNGKEALFPASYVEKLDEEAHAALPAMAPKPAYRKFGAAFQGTDAPPPPGGGVNSVGLQEQSGQEQKKGKFGKFGNTMAHSAAGGVGFGAGAAIGGGLVRAIF